MIADKDVILDYNYYSVSNNNLIQNNKFASIDMLKLKTLVNGFAFVPLHRTSITKHQNNKSYGKSINPTYNIL